MDGNGNGNGTETFSDSVGKTGENTRVPGGTTWITFNAAAKILRAKFRWQFNRVTLGAWLRAGLFPGAVKFGTQWAIPLDSVESFQRPHWGWGKGRRGENGGWNRGKKMPYRGASRKASKEYEELAIQPRA